MRLKGPVQSFQQGNIIHTLSKAASGGFTVGQLKTAFVDDSPNVSSALNKMVNLGFASRRRGGENQRTIYVPAHQNRKMAHVAGDEFCGPHDRARQF